MTDTRVPSERAMASSSTWVAAVAVGLLALSVSGWLGGKLSYHYGVRVADEQTQASGFRA